MTTSDTQTSPARPRVVIIGSGFGGLFAAQRLKRADVDITLIARTTHHLFQPMLYQVATGIVSEGEIAPATRIVLRDQKNVTVLLGDVFDIDVNAQTVTSRLLERVTVTPYDYLIIAAGADQSYFGNDQFATYAPGMKTIDDALELRGRILGAFEAAEVSTDEAERRKIFDQLHVMMLADAPLIFLYNQVDTAVVSKRLQGFAPWVASKPRLWEVSVAK